MRKNIEAERSRNGLTKSQLSEKLKISLTTYNAYLRGAAIPSDKLVAMADLFGVSTDYILGRTSSPTG